MEDKRKIYILTLIKLLINISKERIYINEI